jgi:hypothetical protein
VKDAAASSTSSGLIAKGCRQGALLKAPAHIVYLQAAEPANTTGARWQVAEESILDAQLVVTSQDCDIAAPAKTEPFIEALAARWTANPSEVYTARKRNSARIHFLADGEGKILVADARRKVQIAKEALTDAEFDLLFSDERDRARFGLWVAGRYSRPAIDDGVVNALHKPLVKAIDKVLDSKGEIQGILDRVDEMLFRISGPGPWTADFVAMVPEGKELEPEEEAEFSGWLEDTLVAADGGAIEKIRVAFHTMKSISAHDYLSLTPFQFDHYSQEAELGAA